MPDGTAQFMPRDVQKDERILLDICLIDGITLNSADFTLRLSGL